MRRHHLPASARRASIGALIAVSGVAASLALTAGPASAHATHGNQPTPVGRSIADLFPYPDADITLVNHRGLSPGFPENTLSAYRNSIAMGVDAIEIDLRATKDGTIVVMHDSTVDRTTDGTGKVNDLTLAQIKTLDAGSYLSAEFAGERVPTFEEALEVVKGTGVRLLLDIKESSQVAEIVRLTEAHDMASNVIVGPRSVAALNEFKALNPNLTTLGFIPTVADADAFIAAGVDYIRLWPEWITASRDSADCQADYAIRVAAYESGQREHPGSASCAVEHVNSLGTPVWTTSEELGYPEMDTLIQLGATGLLSDVPAVLDQLLDDIQAKRFATADEKVATLQSTISADARRHHPYSAKQVQHLIHELRHVHRAIAASDAEQACGRLDQVIEEIDRARIPAARAAGYITSVKEIKAILACSQY